MAGSLLPASDRTSAPTGASEFAPALPGWARPRVDVALAVLAIVLRVVLLLAPGKEVSPRWVLPEELHRGNVARELLTGPLLDVQDYHHAPNVGGSLVVAILAAPFFVTLGENLLALRLPSILMHGAAVFLLARLLRRHAGPRAALAGGLLYAIAPPGYLLLSITAFGTHAENNTFVLLALTLYFELAASARGSRRESSFAFALGLTSGFATYFGYSFVPMAGTWLVFAFVRDRTFFLRRWTAFAAFGAVVGFLPWVRYNVLHDFAGVLAYDVSLIGSPPERNETYLGKLLWFTFVYSPRALFLRDWKHFGLQWTEPIVALLLAAALVSVAWWERRRIAAAARRVLTARAEPPMPTLGLVCVVFVLLFTIAMLAARPVSWAGVAGIAHDGRYIAPLFPFLCIAAGLASERFSAGGERVRRADALAVYFTTSVFLLGWAAQLDVRAFPGALRQSAVSDHEFARWFAWTYKTDAGRLTRLVDGLERSRDEEVRDGTLFVLGQTLKSRLIVIPEGDARRGRLRAACVASLTLLRARVAPRYAPYFEEPLAGETLYSWERRDDYWKEREARGAPARATNSRRD
ncbi:MAG: glycosyltransferase family 39 protein [Planctomycetes bacterium]|nr:glycosyltransferase family 39 protein [Planctomycetota bacterium]